VAYFKATYIDSPVGIEENYGEFQDGR